MGTARGLGRGLEALLTRGEPPPRAATGSLPITSIQSGPSQPRSGLREQPLAELAASIRSNGILQPIIVRPIEGAPAGYEIVAGERRWQAAKLAGLTEIPAIVRRLTDQEAVAVALIENIQREELTPAEEARALKRLSNEFSLTHDRLSEVVGRSRSAVSNLIRLLDLPEAVLTLIDEKRLSMGHARALLGIEEDADREECSRLIVERELSVRQTEELVRKGRRGEGRDPKTPPELSVISEVIKSATVHVQLHQKANGPSRIIVHLKDSTKRDALIEAIKRAVE